MKKILLYGTSIFLAGLTELLQALPELHFQTCQRLADLGDLTVYETVVIDLNNPQTADVLTLLRARPDLTVIGVNPASSTVSKLVGQVYLAEKLEDVLVHLAGEQTPTDDEKRSPARYGALKKKEPGL